MLPSASVTQLASTQLKWPVFVGAWLLVALLALFFGLLSSVASIFAVIVVVSLVFSALALFNYRIGVVLLVLLMPIANTSLFPHELLGVTGLNPFNLLLLLTLVSYFLPRFVRRDTYTLFPAYFYGLYLLPVLVAGLVGATHVGQIPYALDIGKSLQFHGAFGYFRDMVMRPLFTLIVAYLVAAAVRDSKSPERFLGLGLFTVVILVIMEIGILQWRGFGIFALSHAEYRSLLGPLGMHANQVGPFLGIAFGIALFTRAAMTRFVPKMLATAVILVCLVGGVLSFSRGGFVIFGVAGLIYLVTQRSFKNIAISVILLAIAAPLAPHQLYDRITLGWDEKTISTDKTDELSAGRGYIWEKIIPEIPRNLVTGGGVNSILWSSAVQNQELNLMTHPHNAYLHTLMDYGLLGGALLVLFFRKLYKQWRSISKDDRLSPIMRGFFKGVCASFVGYLFFALTSSGVLPESDQFFLWISMGILYGMLARTTEEHHAENENPLKETNRVPRYGAAL